MRELLNTLADLRTKYRKYRKHREAVQAVKELRALTDRELNDMGLTRGEIYDVVHNGSNPNLRGWV